MILLVILASPKCYFGKQIDIEKDLKIQDLTNVSLDSVSVENSRPELNHPNWERLTSYFSNLNSGVAHSICAYENISDKDACVEYIESCTAGSNDCRENYLKSTNMQERLHWDRTPVY